MFVYEPFFWLLADDVSVWSVISICELVLVSYTIENPTQYVCPVRNTSSSHQKIPFFFNNRQIAHFAFITINTQQLHQKWYYIYGQNELSEKYYVTIRRAGNLIYENS